VSVKAGIVRLLATIALASTATIFPVTEWHILDWTREYTYLPGVLALLLLERLGIKFDDPISDFSTESQMVLVAGSFLFWILIISMLWRLAQRLWQRLKSPAS
jgi:hypothetical protein